MKTIQLYIMNVFILIIPGIVFAWLKLSDLTYRLGDSNLYFYMADAFWKGILPYRDYFLADPPVLIYSLSLVRAIIGEHFLMFMVLPIVLELSNAYLLYYFCRLNNLKIAYITPLLYLASLSTIATSDSLTGVQLVIFFTLIAFINYQNKNYVLSSFFWSLALLTKLYTAAAFIGFLIAVYRQNKPQFFRTILLVAGFSFLLLLPFLFSYKEVINYLLIYNLNRPEGMPKIVTFLFFFKTGWLLLALSSIGLYKNRSHIFALPLVCQLLFFTAFRDSYYVYLQYVMFFIIYFVVTAVSYLLHAFNQQGRSLVAVGLLILYIYFTLSTLILYENGKDEDVILQVENIASYVQQQKTPIVYGSYDIAPLIALLSKKRLFRNIADTNVPTFKSGAQNKEEISKAAVETGVLLVGGVDPKDEKRSIRLYFDASLFTKYCKRLKFFKGVPIGFPNTIGVYYCGV